MKSIPRSFSSIFLALVLIMFLPRAGVADVVLSEIVSANGALGFTAADGSVFDWIELHNMGASPVDLSNFYLTDDATRLTKWRFARSFVIPAGGFRIVFASDRNGLFDDEEHTNFKLSSSPGEYLALVESDGTTVASEFAPSFPPLPQYISFGRISGGAMLGTLDSATPNASNTAAAQVARVLSFTASDEVIPGGDELTLTWATENADTVTLDVVPTELNPTASSTDVILSGSTIRSPSVDTTYRIRATNAFGSHELLVEVSVGPQFQSFKATPEIIASGGSTVLEWDVTGSNISLDIDGTEIESWRRGKIVSLVGAPEADTVVPITLNATNPSGSVSTTVNVTVLALNAELPPLPSLVISEFYLGYDGTRDDRAYHFFEFYNLGSEPLDLEGIQFVGSGYFQFSDVDPTVLDTNGYALVVADRVGFAEAWPGNRNVVGQFDYLPILTEVGGNLGQRLLDRYGRLIEQLNGGLPLVDYLSTSERVDVASPPIFPDNWRAHPSADGLAGGGTPGEGYFEISKFELNPPQASPGDTVMIEWETNREVPMTITNGIGAVSGTSGSAPFVVPLNVTEVEFTLVASLEFSTVGQTVCLTLPPVIRDFWSSETAITRGGRTTLDWIIEGRRFLSTCVDPEVGDQAAPVLFTPLIQGFPTTSFWRFLPDGSELGPEWRDVDFDDGSWSLGRGVFGYGNDIETTTIQRGEWVTAYFRRHFSIDEADEIESLSVQLLIDDGAEVFINGSEVLRELLPDGEIDASTRASSHSPNDGRVYRDFSIDSRSLVEGDNLIAVGAHNVIPNTQDFGFDLGLQAVKAIPADGRKNYTLTASNPAGTSSATVTILFEQKTPLADWIATNGLEGDPTVTDSDLDGIVDLVEFATGTDPLAFSPPPVFLEIDSGGKLVVKYPRHLSHAGVLLRAESSTDLSIWNEMREDFVFESCIAPDGSSIAECVSRTYVPITESLYLRLVVELTQ